MQLINITIAGFGLVLGEPKSGIRSNSLGISIWHLIRFGPLRHIWETWSCRPHCIRIHPLYVYATLLSRVNGTLWTQACFIAGVPKHVLPILVYPSFHPYNPYHAASQCCANPTVSFWYRSMTHVWGYFVCGALCVLICTLCTCVLLTTNRRTWKICHKYQKHVAYCDHHQPCVINIAYDQCYAIFSWKEMVGFFGLAYSSYNLFRVSYLSISVDSAFRIQAEQVSSSGFRCQQQVESELVRRAHFLHQM